MNSNLVFEPISAAIGDHFPQARVMHRVTIARDGRLDAAPRNAEAHASTGSA